MREILFRGKRTDSCEWVYGNLYITHTGKYEISYYNENLDVERYTHAIIPETLSQYTGLTDKNGNKIFEGDILNMHGGCEQMDISEYDLKCRVVYTRKNYGAEIGYTGMRLDCEITTPLMLEGALTVIGNIHDNPEFLKEC